VFSYRFFLLTAALASVTITTAIVAAQQPPIKVNVINVCAPSSDDQKELSAALAKVPAEPVFGPDFEVSRGRSTLDPNTPIPGMQPLPPGAAAAADWVRIRREFPDATLFSNVQYSFSVDGKNMVETLVLRVREPKSNDMMEISVEDSASAVASAAAMLSSSTPLSRVRLERFGKSSLALARCSGDEGSPATDQTAYEPIFKAATSIMARYREALNASQLVSEELARLGKGNATKTSVRTTAKPSVGNK
jgi:hypothetical protein